MKTFEEYVDEYCAAFADLLGGTTPEEVRERMCDLAELRKSYDENRDPGLVAWDDYDASL